MPEQEFMTPKEYVKLAMAQGFELHREGDHYGAAEKFEKALNFAQENEERSLAAEARGIALRLAGDKYARFSFMDALRYSKNDPERLGVIRRKLAILLLDEGKFGEAQNMLSKALWEHSWADDKPERTITLGFLGQALWLNEKFDPALDCFAESRFRHLPRVWWLMLKTGHHLRLAEAVLIVIDPDFAERIKRQKQSR